MQCFTHLTSRFVETVLVGCTYGYKELCAKGGGALHEEELCLQTIVSTFWSLSRLRALAEYCRDTFYAGYLLGILWLEFFSSSTF